MSDCPRGRGSLAEMQQADGPNESRGPCVGAFRFCATKAPR
jgi:hypothetical protein